MLFDNKSLPWIPGAGYASSTVMTNPREPLARSGGKVKSTGSRIQVVAETAALVYRQCRIRNCSLEYPDTYVIAGPQKGGPSTVERRWPH